MRVKQYKIFVFCLLLGIILLFFTDNYYNAIIYSLQLYTLVRLVNNVGFTIAYLDFLAFYTVLDTLLMPIFGYSHFNENNPISLLWGKYMRVPLDVYFSYMIPANIFLILGLTFFQKFNTTETIGNIKQNLLANLESKGKIGVYFIFIGFISSEIGRFVPGSLSFVFGLLSWLRLVGPIYLYYSNHTFRKQFLYLAGVLFFLQSIASGMFGEFVSYSLLLGIILIVGWRVSLPRKLVLVFSMLLLVAVLQSVKYTYRNITWKNIPYKGLTKYDNSSFEIFSTLVIERLTDLSSLFDENVLFGLYVRMNQGYLISVVMDRVPSIQPLAEGRTILRSIGGILLPRFLWPDKPTAGGAENMRTFLGVRGPITFSMNIGPYGEGYGNFGNFGGLVYVFFYGLSLAYLFHTVLKFCIKAPSLLVFLPFMFFYSLTVETDLFGTFNPIIKSGIFLFILFWVSKNIFKTEL